MIIKSVYLHSQPASVHLTQQMLPLSVPPLIQLWIQTSVNIKGQLVLKIMNGTHPCWIQGHQAYEESAQHQPQSFPLKFNSCFNHLKQNQITRYTRVCSALRIKTISASCLHVAEPDKMAVNDTVKPVNISAVIGYSWVTQEEFHDLWKKSLG